MAGTGVEPTGDSFLQAPKFFEFAIIGRNDRDKNAEAHTVVAIRWARNTLGSTIGFHSKTTDRRSTLLFNNSKAVLTKLSMLVITLTIIGCEPAAKPKPGAGADTSSGGPEHVHAETFAEAVKELESICATIKAAFAKDDAEAAHDPLHEVGHVLEEIPDLVAKSALDEAGKAEALSAKKSLYESFDAVDQGMHGSGGKKYSEVAETIDAALKILVDKAKS